MLSTRLGPLALVSAFNNCHDNCACCLFHFILFYFMVASRRLCSVYSTIFFLYFNWNNCINDNLSLDIFDLISWFFKDCHIWRTPQISFGVKLSTHRFDNCFFFFFHYLIPIMIQGIKKKSTNKKCSISGFYFHKQTISIVFFFLFNNM